MASILNTVRDLERLRQIVLVLVRHGFGEVVQRTGLGSLAGKEAAQEGKGRPKISLGERLRLVVQDLGPSFVKLGQIVSTRAHAAALSERLVGTDPQVAARLLAEGPAALTQALTREASVLAFNDVFMLVAAIAAATALSVAAVMATGALRKAFK